MSGYVSGTLAILCINLIFAYAIFVTAAAGQINLGGAGFQAIGAYATAWLANEPEMPMWVMISTATLVTALIGFLISFPVLRTRGVYMVLATFAFGEVVSGFLLRSAIFGGAMGMVVPQHIELWVLIVCVAAVTLATFYLMATRFGLAMRSLNDDEEAATVLGVNVRAVQVTAFTIGGAFAGLSGALYALNFLGTARWQPVLHDSAGTVPHRRVLALFHLWRVDRADDGGAARGHRHPRSGPPLVALWAAVASHSGSSPWPLNPP
jgi:branched-chain amino acid transport system permease protein